MHTFSPEILKIASHFSGARGGDITQFHNADPQKLGVTVQNYSPWLHGARGLRNLSTVETVRKITTQSAFTN